MGGALRPDHHAVPAVEAGCQLDEASVKGSLVGRLLLGKLEITFWTRCASRQSCIKHCVTLNSAQRN